MRTHRLALLFAVVLTAVEACAQQLEVFASAVDESANYQTETLLDGLDNPTGLVVHPTQAKTGPYDLYLSESGAGRVLHVSTKDFRQLDEVVVDFPLGTFGTAPSYRVGPLALAFVTRSKIIVGAKGGKPGQDQLASYRLPTDGGAQSADQPDHLVGPLVNAVAAEITDLQFGAIAIADKTCFLTTGGEDSQGWLLKAGVQANRLAYLDDYVKLQKKTALGAPGGIAIIPEPRPAFLVVGLMGSRTVPQDSQLAFFIPSSGDLVMQLSTGLSDIISLAYSPSGQLYAADFSWHDPEAGGIYRLDDARLNGQQTCRAVKIASVIRPFSLAFTPDGTLYATAFGAGENTSQGQLIKITGNL